MPTTAPTVADIRARVAAASAKANARFTATTGCASAREFVDTHFRAAVVGSASPEDAMRRALISSREG